MGIEGKAFKWKRSEKVSELKKNRQSLNKKGEKESDLSYISETLKMINKTADPDSLKRYGHKDFQKKQFGARKLQKIKTEVSGEKSRN